MKKLFSTALALVLTLSMGTAAFAAESSDPYNGKLDLKPTITKT